MTFLDVPVSERARIRAAGEAVGRLAFRHVGGVLIAPPPGTPGKLNSGSAFLLQMGQRHFLGTAAHVVKGWEDRIEADEAVLFQVGATRFDPQGRVAWRDDKRDIIFLELSSSEAQSTGLVASTPTGGWPPPRAQEGDFVVVSGYPASGRRRLDGDLLEFRSLSFVLSVTAVHDDYFVCQFQREFWVPDGDVVLPPSSEIGGMSGGPALLLGKLSYPIVGVVSEHNASFELMRISVLAGAPGIDILESAA